MGKATQFICIIFDLSLFLLRYLNRFLTYIYKARIIIRFDPIELVMYFNSLCQLYVFGALLWFDSQGITKRSIVCLVHVALC